MMHAPIFRSLFCAVAVLASMGPAAPNCVGCGDVPIPAPAPALPPPPPCIDNRCAERPGHLKCVEWANGGPATCSMWRVLYENHCVCHEWGPREPDGGTP